MAGCKASEILRSETYLGVRRSDERRASSPLTLL